MSSVILVIKLAHPWGQAIALSSVTMETMGAPRTLGTNYHASNKPFLNTLNNAHMASFQKASLKKKKAYGKNMYFAALNCAQHA